MRREDSVRLEHRIDAARSAGHFVSGHARQDLDSDPMLRFALVRAIEIIGEAASRLSPEARSLMPSVPWPALVAMRDRLIHAYFDVDLDILWNTATIESPTLLALLSPFEPP